jgi:hypothetical protein
VREKARVQGAMASIVEWQSLRMQEYRYSLRNRILLTIADFMGLFGVRRPVNYGPQPAVAGDYDHALHVDHPEAPSLLEQYLDKPEPRLGGAPKETEKSQDEDWTNETPERKSPGVFHFSINFNLVYCTRARRKSYSGDNRIADSTCKAHATAPRFPTDRSFLSQVHYPVTLTTIFFCLHHV